MAGRALWKGFLKFAEISCPVALHSAASTSERVSFNTLSRMTGNRVRREYVDINTWKVVEKEDQIKGYEVDDNRYVLFEPDELSAVVPPSDKTLRIQSYVPFQEIDDLYFDKPYYLLQALLPSARSARRGNFCVDQGCDARIQCWRASTGGALSPA